MTHLQLSLEEFPQAGGQSWQVPVSLLHLRLQTPLELGAEHLLLVGEVDDALLHAGELRGEQLLELWALRVHQRLGPGNNVLQK